MPDTEKRKQPRVEVRLPVNYICLDKSGTELGTGMGRTVNVSRGGIYMESPSEIDSDFVVLMTIDVKNELVQVKGKVAHCRVNQSGIYETGIQFIGTPEENIKSIKMLVETYHATKNTS